MGKGKTWDLINERVFVEWGRLITCGWGAVAKGRA